MQISILGTDGAYLANNGSNAISILGPDGNLLPNDGSNFVCVTGADGAYQPNDGTVEAFSILGTDGALLPYVEGNSFSVLDENGALAIPVTDNLISLLLWGGAPGVWYAPSDMSTMFTDYTGVTPVTATGDTVGLILDKHEGLVLGSELLTDPEFTSAFGASWTAVSATATNDLDLGVCNVEPTGAFGLIQQDITTVADKWYKVTISAGSGSTSDVIVCDIFDTVGIVLSFVNLASSSLADYTFYFKANGTAARIRFYINSAAPDPTGIFLVGSASIKLIAGNHAYQLTSASRPIFRDVGGLRYLEFDGVDDYLRATFTIAQPIDRISAIRQVSSTPDDRLFGGVATAAGTLYQTGTSPRMALFSGTATFSIGDLAVGVNGVVTERHDGASSRLTANNVAYSTGNAGTTVPGGITIGASNLSANPGNLFLHQMIMRGSTTAMTDAQIAACRALCAAKSGVTL